MTTLLAIGDMHLGRLPASLPDELRSLQRELGPEAAWMRSVTEAINRKVDGVVLAGDLVERSRDFFVAYGQLKAGLEKLATAGIRTWAVAGNHDVHVLPRLAEELDHLTLLGAGGRWQSTEIGDLDLIGWSFPQAEVRQSPLEDFPGRRGKRPLIGLLHCDRDQSNSRHAPVSSKDLESAPVSAWLLGHIHQPDPMDGDRPIGYLGSVSALRASETGDRGPWLIEAGKGKVRAEQLVLAPLRYESIDLDVSQLDDPEQLGSAILAGARDCVGALGDLCRAPEAIGLRLRLVGRSRIGAAIATAARQWLEDARPWTEQSIQLFIDKLELAFEPDIELERLAERQDPVGLLARRVLALRGADEVERERLLERAREQLGPLAEQREFRGLGRPLDDAALGEYLERAAMHSLSSLLAQTGAAG
ncbi:metallophosphoesterase family protein [Wenzhouxiangella marina]|uniref:Metallophosphoesterase n=1 Tax=Wenzhouxiangella marina TaxID=1579979 RepID=A0A0K0XTA7_9GAMM|nr:metallophosphoesterase [Wenzhouxiangella marina]AKS40923.1 Metallophosphoesterase [Wenzhouxiangella marina]MBB6087797.1 DNA repair exonuclease SbcCD nuclease subunit [Wenzhouxiangella marina]